MGRRVTWGLCMVALRLSRNLGLGLLVNSGLQGSLDLPCFNEFHPLAVDEISAHFPMAPSCVLSSSKIDNMDICPILKPSAFKCVGCNIPTM